MQFNIAPPPSSLPHQYLSQHYRQHHHFQYDCVGFGLLTALLTPLSKSSTSSSLSPEPEQAELLEFDELHCSLSLSKRSVTTGESYSAADSRDHIDDGGDDDDDDDDDD